MRCLSALDRRRRIIFMNIRIAVSLVLALAAVRLTAQSLTVTDFSASGGAGSEDGAGPLARFENSEGIAVDGAGNLYLTDYTDSVIRKVSPAGAVTTLAGVAGVQGTTDGTGSAARFRSPRGIAVDAAGTLYVTDFGANTIRKVSPDGAVTTLAGSPGVSGSTDGTGAVARFSGPWGVAFDGNGDLLVADWFNNTLRKVTPAGVVTTMAGLAGTTGTADGIGSAARFNRPSGVAVGVGGVIYVADTLNYTLRSVLPDGTVSTLAGLAGTAGTADGTGAAARFWGATGVAFDPLDGNLLVSDNSANDIRRVTQAGVVTTLAGSPGAQSGNTDGTGSAARFSLPYAIAVDGAGTAYIADSYNYLLRKMTPANAVTTLAGRNVRGAVDGPAAGARFNSPMKMTRDGAGNVYLADSESGRIRKIAPDDTVSTLTAGVSQSYGVAAAADGTVYVAATFGYAILKVTPAGAVSLLAGGPQGETDGVGAAARFCQPSGIVINPAETLLFVTDMCGQTVRQITLPGAAVTTVAGLGYTPGNTNGTGSAARFQYPTDVTLDGSGNLLVLSNGVVRKIVMPGAAVSNFAIVGNNPYAITPDGAGGFFVADSSGNAIRRVSGTGIVTSVAGSSQAGSSPGTGSVARFNYPMGVVVRANGELLISDTSNHMLRRGVFTTLADSATVDQATGEAGFPRQLDTSPQTATSWDWRLIRRPSGATADLSDPALRNPTFTPDRADLYRFRLTATNFTGKQRITTVDLSGCNRPVITASPAGQAACIGSPLTLSAGATSATGVSYQWKKDGATIPGATGPSYLLSPVIAGDEGSYVCEISNACGVSTTVPAALTVQSSPLSPGNSLLGGMNAGLVTFNWATASGATVYDVMRCAGTCTPNVAVASPAVTSYSEPDDPNSYFYAAEARNACGSTP
jgi:hypothetical protein